MRIRGLLFNLLLAMVINQDFESTKSKNPQTGSFILNNVYNPLYLIESETLGQINNSWIKTYTLKYNGEKTTVPLNEIILEYFAENLSNSKLEPHTLPKKSNPRHYENKEIIYEPIRHTLNEGNKIFVPIINGSDRHKCREKLEMKIKKIKKPKLEDLFIEEKSDKMLELNPGDELQVVIKIEHDHFLYGKYDPLFGDRKISLKIGTGKIYDEFSISNEIAPVVVIPKLNTVPLERIDEYNENIEEFDKRKNLVGRIGKFLYLAADIPGYQYYRFEDIEIRAGDIFRLKFDYLIAYGTEGSCNVRIMEYQDTPNAWYKLDGGFDAELGLEKSVNLENAELMKPYKGRLYQELFVGKPRLITLPDQNTPKKQGKWERFEYIFKTRNDTTTLGFDFRIYMANFGEMWIDLSSLKFDNLSVEENEN